MASFSYSDDEDQKRGAQQDKFGQPQAPTGPTPTFAELQRRGMPRPPPQMGAASQALYGAAGAAPPPPAGPAASQYEIRNTGGGGRLFHRGNAGGAGLPVTASTLGVKRPATPPPPMTPGGFQAPQTPADYYKPTGQLDQGNLEGYLYDMLANPTATPAYKNSMRHIQSGIDTEASKRGVFYSTLPVGAYGEAGAQLAAGLQGQAYDQLRGYNRDYAELLMALLGAT